MANSRRMKIYLGVNVKNDVRRVFRSFVEPTEESHPEYGYVTGPFRTVRAANFMRDYGANNPHCRNVAEAERLAAEERVFKRIRFD